MLTTYVLSVYAVRTENTNILFFFVSSSCKEILRGFVFEFVLLIIIYIMPILEPFFFFFLPFTSDIRHQIIKFFFLFFFGIMVLSIRFYNGTNA